MRHVIEWIVSSCSACPNVFEKCTKRVFAWHDLASKCFLSFVFRPIIYCSQLFLELTVHQTCLSYFPEDVKLPRLRIETTPLLLMYNFVFLCLCTGQDRTRGTRRVKHGGEMNGSHRTFPNGFARDVTVPVSSIFTRVTSVYVIVCH